MYGAQRPTGELNAFPMQEEAAVSQGRVMEVECDTKRAVDTYSGKEKKKDGGAFLAQRLPYSLVVSHINLMVCNEFYERILGVM